MKQRITTLKQLTLSILFLGCIATAMLAPMASNNLIFNLGDLQNHIAMIIQAKLALLEGQFPLRVAPLEHENLRYPFFQFYSPTSYMLAAVLYQWIITNPVVIYKLMLGFMLVVGGFYMQRLAYCFVKSYPAAILASVVYVTSPYYIVLINHMGAFNEALALGTLPPVLYYTWQQVNCFNKKNFFVLAFCWYLLATLHLLTFINTSFFLGLFLLLLTLQTRQWKNLFLVGIAYAFGCALAAWYLAPTFLLGNRLLVAHYHDFFSFLSIYELMSPNTNIPKIVSSSLDVHPAIGWPIIFAFGVSIYALYTEKKINPIIFCLLSLFIVGFLFIWSPLNLWHPSFFKVEQYSWRLLGQLLWIGALLFAWSCCWLFKNNLNAKHVVLGLFCILLSTRPWFATPELAMQNYEGIINKPMLTYDSFNYIMDVPDIHKTQSDSTTLTVKQIQPYCHQQGTITSCKIVTAPNIQELELPIIYYPALLKITLNGKVIPYSYTTHSKRPIVTIKPKSGINIIQVSFRGLFWANIISQVSWVAWLIGMGFIIGYYYAKRIFIYFRVSFRRSS